jgi:hypothetical protein
VVALVELVEASFLPQKSVSTESSNNFHVAYVLVPFSEVLCLFHGPAAIALQIVVLMVRNFRRFEKQSMSLELTNHCMRMCGIL